jgi:hypothetical protein
MRVPTARGRDKVTYGAIQASHSHGHPVRLVSHRRVEPSMSAKSNVTVPVGSSWINLSHAG